MTEPPKETDRRRDIDGLRAVAILVVVLYHAGLGVMRGGFVGVDVFFVISGYLIIGLLVEDAEESVRVDFWKFYARRVRRLTPALLVMAGVVISMALLLLTPAELSELFVEARATAGYVANLLFRRTGYFAPAAGTRVLLHTWSLSVEEQFYLVAPIIVAMLVRFRSSQPARRKVAAGLTVVGGASLCASAWFGMRGSSAAAFFLTPSRAWELALGGLIACQTGLTTSLERHPAAREFTAFAGFVAIAIGSVGTGGSVPFPAAILPALGCAVIIACGKSEGSSAVNRALGWRPLVIIGLVSYPWYLLHWPLLAMLRVSRGPGALRDFGIVALSFALAYFVHIFVERPMQRRFRHSSSNRALVIGGLAISAAAIGMAQFGIRLESARAANGPPTPWAAVAAAGVSPFRATCNTPVDAVAPALSDCWLVRGTSHRLVVVWGDSHADAWVTLAHDAVVANPGPGLLQLTKSSCPPVTGLTPRNTSVGRYEACRTFNDNVIHMLDSLRRGGYELSVIMAARWPFYSGESQYPGVEAGDAAWFDADSRGIDGMMRDLTLHLDTTIAALRRLEARVAVIFPPADLPFNAPECVLRWRRNSTTCGAPRGRFERYRARVTGVVDSVFRARGALTLDAGEIFCASELCPAQLGTDVLYYDTSHPSVAGVRLAGRRHPEMMTALLQRDAGTR